MALVQAVETVAADPGCWCAAVGDFTDYTATNVCLFCFDYGRYGAVDEP